MEKQEVHIKPDKESWLISNAIPIFGCFAYVVGSFLDEWMPYHTGVALALLAWAILTYWLPPKSKISLLRWTIQNLILAAIAMALVVGGNWLLGVIFPKKFPGLLILIIVWCLYQIYLFIKMLNE
jgi:VIT1/CCC1 family predicted Fe2+/Mn2+ transporter